MENILPPKTSLKSAFKSLIKPIGFFEENAKLYPDIFQSELFNFSAYVVQHPKYIKHVLQQNSRNYKKGEKYAILRFLAGNGLVTNDTESWLSQRKLIQASFKNSEINNSLVDINKIVKEYIDLVKGKDLVNINDLMGLITIGVIATLMFQTQAEEMIPTIREEMEVYQKYGNILLRIPAQLPENTPDFPLLFRFKKSIKRLDKIIVDVIQSREQQLESLKKDLLDRLINAHQEDSNGNMSRKQLRDEVLTIFLAGHETTLLSLTWTFYMLAKHPEIRNNVRNEVEMYFDEENLIDSLHKMKYTGNVINEAMRLYPPAYLIVRKSINEDYIGNYFVPKNKDVFVNIYGIHRHPEYWSDPLKFDPDRFNSFQFNEDNRFVFLPFGAGPRICVGAYMSQMEMKIVIANFIRLFDFTMANSGEIVPNPLITLKTSKDVVVKIKKAK